MRRGDSKLQLRPSQVLFAEADVESVGFIHASQLQRILAREGLLFTVSFASSLIRRHGKVKPDSINEGDFVELYSELAYFIAEFQGTPKQFDGTMSKSNFASCLENAGFQLDPPAADMLFCVFDPESSTKMGLHEFLAARMFLQGCVSSFRAFDTQQLGTIQLNFSQWVYASSNAR